MAFSRGPGPQSLERMRVIPPEELMVMEYKSGRKAGENKAGKLQGN